MYYLCTWQNTPPLLYSYKNGCYWVQLFNTWAHPTRPAIDIERVGVPIPNTVVLLRGVPIG